MKSAKLTLFLLFLVLNPGLAANKPPEWPSLTLSLNNLTQSYPSVTVEISNDPVYQRAQKYQAIALRPLIQALAKQYAGPLAQTSVIFSALDGYQAIMPYSTVIGHDGFLAFRDLSATPKNWRPFRFGRESMTPAPFYLVWPGVKQQDKWRFAWPFQLASIQLKPSRQVYLDAAPKPQGETITEGFTLFSQFCIRCHAINGAGGTVGPDLNKPVNPTTVYSKDVLIQRILEAKRFNPMTKMPAFKPLLSSQQAETIIHYLEAIHLQEATSDATP